MHTSGLDMSVHNIILACWPVIRLVQYHRISQRNIVEYLMPVKIASNFHWYFVKYVINNIILLVVSLTEINQSVTLTKSVWKQNRCSVYIEHSVICCSLHLVFNHWLYWNRTWLQFGFQLSLLLNVFHTIA